MKQIELNQDDMLLNFVVQKILSIPLYRDEKMDSVVQMAQIAISMDAIIAGIGGREDEIKLIKNDRNEMIPHLGINYYARSANDKGGYMVFDFKQVAGAGLKRKYILSCGEQAGVEDLVYTCKLISMEKWEKVKGSISFNDFCKGFATEGLGIYKKDEMQGDPPIGKSWDWSCRQRAEKDALKRAFPISPPIVSRWHKLFELQEFGISSTKEESSPRSISVSVEEINKEIFG